MELELDLELKLESGTKIEVKFELRIKVRVRTRMGMKVRFIGPFRNTVLGHTPQRSKVSETNKRRCKSMAAYIWVRL